jgi:FkbM family methyltransferase
MTKFKEFLKFHLLPKKIYLGLSAQNKYRRAERSQETELKILPEIVDRDKTAIDIGANTGLYTYFLAKYARDVIAFEPHELFADFLMKAVADNVVVINKGISNTISQLPFYIPVKYGQKQMNIASFDKPTNPDMSYLTQLVDTVTLDLMGFENVGFIKIDVEGHEYSVLQGAEKLIRSQRPLIQVEILGNPEEKRKNRTLALLRDYRYEVYIYTDNELKKMNSIDPLYYGKNFICLPS